MVKNEILRLSEEAKATLDAEKCDITKSWTTASKKFAINIIAYVFAYWTILKIEDKDVYHKLPDP